MITDSELRELAGLSTPKRFVLTVYLPGSQGEAWLPGQFKELSRMLPDGEEGREEREQLDANIEAVNRYLWRHPASGPMCLISCQVRNLLKTISLPFPVRELVRIDSTPYLRPLAELKDEYEGVAVVMADNERARIFLVFADPAASREEVRGHVKNHVKVGGWSQQRYERRRDKELQHYAREVADALRKLETDEKFRYILLAGSRETLQVIHENLPAHMQDKVLEKTLDLKGGDVMNEDLVSVLAEREQEDARVLWDAIASEFGSGGRAALGIEEVMAAAKAGRVDKLLVSRDFKPEAWHCPECRTVAAAAIEICPTCSLPKTQQGGLVNELIEQVILTGGRFCFADFLPDLTEAGGVAALLRY